MEYDVLIIGAGPAGLTAATTLGRARRSVCVVDDGAPRNAASPAVHGFLSRDGESPALLTERACAEAASYGVTFRRAHVSAVTSDGQPPDAADRPAFLATLDGERDWHTTADWAPRSDWDSEDRVVAARRVLLATGLTDELPDVPGLAARWGRDVLHCPYCHGWECADSRIAVLATGPKAVAEALLLRQWSAQVTLLSHTEELPDPEDQARLEARGVTVAPGVVSAVVTRDDHLVGIRLETGVEVAADALFVAPTLRARTSVLASLGVVPEGHSVGVAVPVDADGRTAVPGVWAAGNVTDLAAQVVVAAAEGLHCAIAINSDLVEEDTATAMSAAQRALP